MKFALVNGQRQEAQPDHRGVCQDCQSDMIAHCGRVKIWHWKHKRKQVCDPWWENETEWHRNWKNHFNDDWQEVCHINPKNGERHRADVKTDKGLIIEFQNSPIEFSEIQSREVFYENMVWVVNGGRLKSGRDYKLFCNGLNSKKPTIVDGYFSLALNSFPQCWITSSVPVYFDFQGWPPINPQDEMQDDLWCLLPGGVDQRAIASRISRKQFIDLCTHNPNLLPNRNTFSNQEKKLQTSLAEAAEAFKKIKELQTSQAEAHKQFLNSLIPRQFRRRHL